MLWSKYVGIGQERDSDKERNQPYQIGWTWIAAVDRVNEDHQANTNCDRDQATQFLPSRVLSVAGKDAGESGVSILQRPQSGGGNGPGGVSTRLSLPSPVAPGSGLFDMALRAGHEPVLFRMPSDSGENIFPGRRSRSQRPPELSMEALSAKTGNVSCGARFSLLRRNIGRPCSSFTFTTWTWPPRRGASPYRRER